MMPKRKKVTLSDVSKDFMTITLMFGGAGGALPFIELRNMLRAMEAAAEINEDAALMMEIVAQFAALCRLAAKRTNTSLDD